MEQRPKVKLDYRSHQLGKLISPEARQNQIRRISSWLLNNRARFETQQDGDLSVQSDESSGNVLTDDKALEY